MKHLKSFYKRGQIEAGCDEAGRGCLAGPVFAAAVIFPKGYTNKEINDSKKLKAANRDQLRAIIEKDALSYAVEMMTNQEIDRHNILRASLLTMHKAINNLTVRPEFLLIDGNKFIPYQDISHECMIKGDGRFLSIAAASILAKTHRDEYMKKIHQQFPQYGWERNMGYPTVEHRKAIMEHGPCGFHRKSFRVKEVQRKLAI